MIELAPRTAIGQILGVHWTGLMLRVGSAALALSIAAAPTASAGPRSSNPAFLGIMMHDQIGSAACMIEAATRESPAEAAGLRTGDVVLAVDDRLVANCAMLLDEITARAPGDAVRIKVQREGHSAPVVASVQLTTRDALLRKVIGKPMIETKLVGVEDGEIYDLAARRGSPAIVGLYHPACVDCTQLFTKFLDWSRDKARRGGTQVLVLAVAAPDSVRDLKLLQKSIDVPLAVGEIGLSGRGDAPFSRDLSISDRDRLGVIVIDGRGLVQYIGPIAPNSEDTDAVLDELFAAADQAARRSK